MSRNPKRAREEVEEDVVSRKQSPLIDGITLFSEQSESESEVEESSKKAKKDPKPTSSSSSSAQLKDDQGNVYFDLGGNKRCTLSTVSFLHYSINRLTTMNSSRARSTLISANVSHYSIIQIYLMNPVYEKDGQTLPGKKGIALAIDTWQKLVAHVDEINALLQK